MSRVCGECDLCCYEARVDFPDFSKPPHSPCPFQKVSGSYGCSIYASIDRPSICSAYKCFWLRGHGGDHDRPDKNGIIASIGHFNGGSWLFVREFQENAIFGTGRQMLIDMVNLIDVPAVITAFGSKPPNDTGDYIVVKNSLKEKSSQTLGDFVVYLDKERTIGLYKLREN